MERLEKIKKSWVKRPLSSRLWILALFLLVTTVEVRNRQKFSSVNGIRRIAAKRDLKAGIILSVHDLTVALESPGLKARGLSYSEQELDEILGARLLSDVSAGTIIHTTQIEEKKNQQFSSRVPKGLRAFLIRTQSRLPIEQGDRIDLNCKKNEGERTLHLSLQDKKILALKRNEDHQELLVALTPTEVVEIDPFAREGWVDVVLRNPQDNSINSPLKDERKRRKTRNIQIIEEG